PDGEQDDRDDLATDAEQAQRDTCLVHRPRSLELVRPRGTSEQQEQQHDERADAHATPSSKRDAKRQLRRSTSADGEISTDRDAPLTPLPSAVTPTVPTPAPADPPRRAARANAARARR